MTRESDPEKTDGLYQLDEQRRKLLKLGALALPASSVLTASPKKSKAADADSASFVAEQGDQQYEVTALSNGESIEEFYDYHSAEAHTTTDIEQDDVSHLFFWDGPNGLSFVIIHDRRSDNEGGEVALDFSGLPDQGSWVVRDDNPGNDNWYNDRVEWFWNGTRTDGGAFRGGLDSDPEITIDPSFSSGISEWQLLSGDANDPDRTQLDMKKPLTIRTDASQPEILPDTFEIFPYPVKVGEQPQVSTDVEFADEVRLKASYIDGSGDEKNITRNMINLEGNTWETEKALPSISEPGTRVDLTIEANNTVGNSKLSTFDNEYTKSSEREKALGYYIFQKVKDVAVIVGIFSDKTALGGDFDKPSDIKKWEKARLFDINHYFGSALGSMGEVGFSLEFRDNNLSLYDVGKNKSSYSDNGEEFLDDLKQTSGVSVSDYDFWVGTHPGTQVKGESAFEKSGEVYASAIQFRGTTSSGGTVVLDRAFGVWLHEFGHLLDMEHIYKDGNVDWRSVMASGDKNGPLSPLKSNLIPPAPFTSISKTGLPRGSSNIDWLGRSIINLDSNQKETIQVDSLYDYQAGDAVPMVSVDNLQDTRTRFILETRPDINNPSKNNPDSSAIIYREEEYAINIPGDDLLQEINVVDDLFDPGATVIEKTGLSSPVEVEFTLSSKRDGKSPQATLAVEAGGGKSNTITTSIRTTSGLPSIASDFLKSNPGFTIPDIDLKARDDSGNMVGLDEESGEFLNEIPDARASGDRRKGLEWISVPEDAEVEFFVSSEDTGRFAEQTGISKEKLVQRYEISTTIYGEDPQLISEDEGLSVSGTVVEISENTIAPGEEKTGSIPAKVDFDPDTLNQNTGAKWVTTYINIPSQEVSVEDIDLSTVTLNGTIEAVTDNKYGFVKNPTKDEDNDGETEFIAKFQREEVSDTLETGNNVRVTLTGSTNSGVLFTGSDRIKVIGNQNSGKGKK